MRLVAENLLEWGDGYFDVDASRLLTLLVVVALAAWIARKDPG